jgi:transcriptional regulator GlxA family with amidase domain
MSNKRLGAAFVVMEQMLSTSLTLPIEMLRAAEGAARVADRSAIRLNIASVGTSNEPVKTQSGFSFQPEYTLDEHLKTDIVVIPALWRNPRPIIQKYPEVVEWLKKLNENGTIIIAVGTGCCFMAEAGLLDDKPATTHWHYFDQFQKHYPKVQLKRQYFITQANNLYCAASVNAVADLTVHFIHRVYGADIANHVQRNFSHEIRRDYAETSYYDDKHRYHPDEDIVQAQIWLQDNCHKEINLRNLAEHFGMSSRNFNRRFKNATDQTPLQYLQEIRIDMAKDLLQTSNLSINEIAYRVGYKDMGHFAALFKKLLTTTPSQYRATVRGKLFTPKTF